MAITVFDMDRTRLCTFVDGLKNIFKKKKTQFRMKFYATLLNLLI